MRSEAGKWHADVARHRTSLCGAGRDADAQSDDCFVLLCFVLKGSAACLRAILQVVGISLRMRRAPSAAAADCTCSPPSLGLPRAPQRRLFLQKSRVMTRPAVFSRTLVCFACRYSRMSISVRLWVRLRCSRTLTLRGSCTPTRAEKWPAGLPARIPPCAFGQTWASAWCRSYAFPE